jgi:hypothetical protein
MLDHVGIYREMMDSPVMKIRIFPGEDLLVQGPTARGSGVWISKGRTFNIWNQGSTTNTVNVLCGVQWVFLLGLRKVFDPL